jgi:hypothetical protein
METLLTIYSRKIKKIKQDKKALNKELNSYPNNFGKLFDKIRTDRDFIKVHFKIDLFKLHYRIKVKSRRFPADADVRKILRTKAILEGLIGLMIRRRQIKKELERIELLLNFDKYKFINRRFFYHFSNEIVKGAYLLQLGHGLHFTTVYSKIDNTIGDKKRPNWQASKEKQKEILSRGGELQNLNMGREGEKWIVWHNNIIKLSSVKFSKFKCSIRNIRYYRFIPTLNGPNLGEKFVSTATVEINDIEDVLKLEVGVLRKLRLVDSRLQNYRAENYKYLTYTKEQ